MALIPYANEQHWVSDDCNTTRGARMSISAQSARADATYVIHVTYHIAARRRCGVACWGFQQYSKSPRLSTKAEGRLLEFGSSKKIAEI
jgi:hypothetical protein